jgi:hypothetical protein
MTRRPVAPQRHHLGLPGVALGCVEQGQLDRLAAAGCRRSQVSG